jgi:hypothetical protein
MEDMKQEAEGEAALKPVSKTELELRSFSGLQPENQAQILYRNI